MESQEFRLAPQERRKIIVASEEVRGIRLRKKKPRPTSGSNPNSSSEFASGAAAVFELLSRAGSPGFAEYIREVEANASASEDLVESWDTFMGIPLITPEEARSFFRFVGEVSDGAAYVLSPFSSLEYHLPARADQEIRQQRLIAFRRIAVALGAKSINVLSVEKKSADGSIKFDASAPFGNAGAPFKGNAEFNKSSSNSETAALSSEYPKPSRPPYIRKEYQPIIESDRMLHDMIAARMEDRALSHNVCLEFDRVDSFDAKLSAKIMSYGVDLGGAVEKSEHTAWSVQVEFWPVED